MGSVKCDICGKYKPNPDVFLASVCHECYSTDIAALKAERNRLREELQQVKAENKETKEFIQFLIRLLVNDWYDGVMPLIEELDAVINESKKWLDEEAWHNYFSV